MHRSATLTALRFVAFTGHVVAAILFTLSRRDNVIVALKYDYTQEDIGWREREVNIACALILTCLGIQAIAFFGGYSFFSATLTPSHLICHTFGGGLIALLNLTKSHYAWIWYLFVFFSCIPTLFDVAAIGTACLRPGKRW